MDGRRARLIDPSANSLPTLTRSSTPATSHSGRWLATGWAALLGVGWPLAFMISMALEPAPANPDAAPPVLIELASSALYAALLITVIAAIRRHPGAARAGVVTGLIAVAFTVTCPLSGHHMFGLWWIGQLSVMTMMLGISVAALGPRSRTT